jgi:hypothetical protein
MNRATRALLPPFPGTGLSPSRNSSWLRRTFAFRVRWLILAPGAWGGGKRNSGGVGVLPRPGPNGPAPPPGPPASARSWRMRTRTRTPQPNFAAPFRTRNGGFSHPHCALTGRQRPWHRNRAGVFCSFSLFHFSRVWFGSPRLHRLPEVPIKNRESWG